jgi:hypothetical protein
MENNDHPLRMERRIEQLLDQVAQKGIVTVIQSDQHDASDWLILHLLSTLSVEPSKRLEIQQRIAVQRQKSQINKSSGKKFPQFHIRSGREGQKEDHEL